MKVKGEQSLNKAADLFKIFGDPTRIKILYLLLDKELCVNQIASNTNMTISAISHQLRILKTANLIKNRREGNTIYYSLSDAHVFNIINQGIEHTEEKDI